MFFRSIKLGFLLFFGIFLSGFLYAYPERIISLAPHITELLFAVGAGPQVVAVSSYSDYPHEATLLPVVADYTGVNIEKIISLKPDLVVAWAGGNNPEDVALLKAHGVNVLAIQIQSMPDIALAMKSLGLLTGHKDEGARQAKHFMLKYRELLATHQHKPKVTVFYALSIAPLLTVSNSSLVQHMIRDCGGVNVIKGGYGGAPEISLDALIALQPQVIFVSSSSSNLSKAFARVNRISLADRLQAIESHRVYGVNADWVDRAGPRAILGMEFICSALRLKRSPF